MKTIHVAAALGALGELVVTDETTAEHAQASMQVLDELGPSMVGVVRFSGLTPWERHPDDELLYVLEGEVDVTVLTAEGGTVHDSLRAGDLFVVKKELWHRQHATATTALLFVTSSDGNAVSDAEDPRA
jgi:quercetin dioxygenase-like cupin family protein